MNELNSKILNDINSKGFSKIEGFFNENEIEKIENKLNFIKKDKIRKGAKISFFPVTIKNYLANIFKLKFKSITTGLSMKRFSETYSFKLIADQFFKQDTNLVTMDSYFSPKSNEKIIDWHADIPTALSKNPENFSEWQRSLKFFVYLTDVQSDNGCLAVLPLSNKINKAITNLILKKKIKVDALTKLTEVREALQNNKDLRLFLEEDKSVGKYNVEKFLDYSSFTQNNGDTSVFDLPLKKGGMIIFDEFCFHRGGPPINSDRVVMRFFYRPKKKINDF